MNLSDRLSVESNLTVPPHMRELERKAQVSETGKQEACT